MKLMHEGRSCGLFAISMELTATAWCGQDDVSAGHCLLETQKKKLRLVLYVCYVS